MIARATSHQHHTLKNNPLRKKNQFFKTILPPPLQSPRLSNLPLNSRLPPDCYILIINIYVSVGRFVRRRNFLEGSVEF